MSESRAVENETLGPRASRPPVKKCGQDARFQTPRFSYVNNVAGRTLTVGWRKQKQEKDVNGYKRCLMNKQVSFTVLGSYSGRNAGDAAILASLMKTLTDEFGEQTRFEVPTTNAGFVDSQYGQKFKVKGISVMPWTGSLRILGIPTMRSIARTDVTLITDGIIFDVNLFNPLFNFLIILIVLVPWAKLCGKKVVCYGVGIGPLRSFFGKLFGRWVGNLCDLIIVRDEDSVSLFREIGVKKKIFLTADAVFQNWSASKERVQSLAKELGVQSAYEADALLGVNVTRYIDQWLSKNQKIERKEAFIQSLAKALVRLKLDRGIEPAVFITQVMDLSYGQTLVDAMSREYAARKGSEWSPALISNVELNNHDILGLDALCSLFVGMRLHSLIIAARAGTPIVGLVYAPKVRSFLKQLKTEEFALDLAVLTQDLIFDSISKAWDQRRELKARQQEIVALLSEQAIESAVIMRRELGFGDRQLDSNAQKHAA